MELVLDAKTSRVVQQEKLQELQAQQKNLKESHAELERISSKIKKHEKLSADDTRFIGGLGWLTALSVTIASIAASV